MPGPPSRPAARTSLAGVFADTPVAAVLAVLRDADTEMRAEQVKAALTERGVPSDALRSWHRIRARLVAHERVGVGGDPYRRTYRYLPEPPSPEQALALLAGHRLPAARRAALVELVRAALVGGVNPDPAGGPGAEDAAIERLEQREIQAVRALAEMAIEVEELAVNEASGRAVVHTVRALTKLAELRPIDRAGEVTRFDRARHSSVGAVIDDGAPVIVLRPGYTWNRPEGEILIARAVVQDRSPR